MKILDFLRGQLPSSKRQVRLLDEATASLRGEIAEQLFSLSVRLGGIEERLAAIEANVDASRAEAKEQAAHAELLLWGLARREGESPLEVRRRFFGEIPPASGLLRALQLGSAQLLLDFDVLCREHELSYWCLSGTLLGAWRHRGFIPWDDDIDVGMMRGDITRLAACVRGGSYQVEERFDPIALCRQVRFRYADADNPCFLDIFIHDWSPDVPEKGYDARCLARERVLSDMRSNEALSARLRSLLERWDPLGRNHKGIELLRVLDDAVGEARAVGDVVEEDEGRSCVWSLDNLGDRFEVPAAFYREQIFPCARHAFEGAEVNVPADVEAVLHSSFKDFYRLPSDMTRHAWHVDLAQLRSDKALTAMRRTLAPERREEFDEVLACLGKR